MLKCRDNADRICGDMFRVTAHSHVDCSLFVCCGLRSIDISGCVKFDNSRLTWLSQSCLKLEDINISNCPNLSTIGVTQLIKRCPNLVIITALNVGRIEDAVGHAISSYIPNVVSLDLAGASGLTAMSLTSLLQKCRKLEHINFSGVPGLSDSVFTGEADVDKNMEVLRHDLLGLHKLVVVQRERVVLRIQIGFPGTATNLLPSSSTTRCPFPFVVGSPLFFT